MNKKVHLIRTKVTWAEATSGKQFYYCKVKNPAHTTILLSFVTCGKCLKNRVKGECALCGDEGKFTYLVDESIKLNLCKTCKESKKGQARIAELVWS